MGRLANEVSREAEGYWHCAMTQVSYHMWEDLWNEKHPHRFEKAWDGEDFALMSIWRQKIQAMVKECRQGAALAMRAEEYVAKLIDNGASEETAVDLAEWLTEIRCGGLPPLLKYSARLKNGKAKNHGDTVQCQKDRWDEMQLIRASRVQFLLLS